MSKNKLNLFSNLLHNLLKSKVVVANAQGSRLDNWSSRNQNANNLRHIT